MDEFIKKIKKSAQKNPKVIAFPEAEEDIILKAVRIIISEKIAYVVLVGRKKIIEKKCRRLGLSLKHISIIDPDSYEKTHSLSEKLYRIRRKKGMHPDEALKLIKDPMYFSVMLLKEGKIDGVVSGARHSTAHTLRPALQIIKCKKGFKKVSGMSFIPYDNRVVLFSDTAVQINPDEKDLAEIALESAENAKIFGLTPKVAMLSFSTRGSAIHENAKKVERAAKIAKRKNPKLTIDGEMQLDAALVPEVAKIKSKGLKIVGDANILVFPSLEAANIGYKMAKLFGNVAATGQVIQGLKKPVNDLSRGCNIEEIVNLTAVTVVQAQNGDFEK